MGKKNRLDRELVRRELVESRTKAQALIMAGRVFSEEKKLDKAGMPVSFDMPLEVRGRPHPWVSRGGLKLEKGLQAFGIDPAGLRCLDIGASTGGFTDVLLSRGAAHVVAVDVGYGQLAGKLRDDPRITVRERTNARYLTAPDVGGSVDLLVCDASFISLCTLLPAPLAQVKPGGRLVALIKPQFEAGRENVPGGVVRDPAVREQVCARVRAWLAARPGWEPGALVESPVHGPKGNVEFLLEGRLR